MWADWAIRPYFHYALFVGLSVFSFLFTGGAFKTVFQVFSGTAQAPIEPVASSRSHTVFLTILSLIALGIAIAPSILSLPVHRLSYFFDAAYSPFLSWVEPEIRTALFLLVNFDPPLDVLANARTQWLLYGWIWGAAAAGWIFAYLVFTKTSKTPTNENHKKPLRRFFEPEQAPAPIESHFVSIIEINILRITFLSRRIIQPLLAGGLMWHVWRAPSSVLRFCFWLFHNGESRRVLSVFLLFVGIGLYWWGQNP